ncbi:MAG: GNAT family N-acetyltransferase [Pyrinomonadaceae bacterium]
MLETERLLMRELKRDDLPWLIENRSDPEVYRYLGGIERQNPDAVTQRLEFYLDCYAKFGFGMYAIISKETGEPIGTGGLQPLGDTGEIEVGYALAKDHWGRGLGYECARAWLEHGFTTLGLERIVAVAHPDNTGSRRIMEKCGMRYEKTDLNYGEMCVFYAVSRDRFLSIFTPTD